MVSTQSDEAQAIYKSTDNKEEIEGKIKRLPLKRLVPFGYNKVKAMNKWTACIYGECGQGKSTVIQELFRLVGKTYMKDKKHGKWAKSKSFVKQAASDPRYKAI